MPKEMGRRFTFAANTVGKSFCPRPPLLSRRTSLKAALDRNAANEGMTAAAASRVAVRGIRTDEEWMVANAVCHVLGIKIKKEHDDENKESV